MAFPIMNTGNKNSVPQFMVRVVYE